MFPEKIVAFPWSGEKLCQFCQSWVAKSYSILVKSRQIAVRFSFSFNSKSCREERRRRWRDKFWLFWLIHPNGIVAYSHLHCPCLSVYPPACLDGLKSHFLVPSIINKKHIFTYFRCATFLLVKNICMGIV